MWSFGIPEWYDFNNCPANNRSAQVQKGGRAKPSEEPAAKLHPRQTILLSHLCGNGKVAQFRCLEATLLLSPKLHTHAAYSPFFPYLTTPPLTYDFTLLRSRLGRTPSRLKATINLITCQSQPIYSCSLVFDLHHPFLSHLSTSCLLASQHPSSALLILTLT